MICLTTQDHLFILYKWSSSSFIIVIIIKVLCSKYMGLLWVYLSIPMVKIISQLNWIFSMDNYKIEKIGFTNKIRRIKYWKNKESHVSYRMLVTILYRRFKDIRTSRTRWSEGRIKVDTWIRLFTIMSVCYVTQHIHSVCRYR